MAKFNKKTAKEIALNSIYSIRDSIVGVSDLDYSLGVSVDYFEQNFEDDLKEKGITPTERRIEVCREEFEKIRKKLISAIDKNLGIT